MLSKIMMPDAAKSYIDSRSSQSKKKTSKTSTALKDTTVETGKITDTIEIGDRKMKSNCVVNCNWEKYKDIINETTTSTGKSPPKRPLKSSESPHKGKRKPKKNIKRDLHFYAPPEMPVENSILTKQVAMDCEMVGIGDGSESMLARVSIVNRHGICIYDKYVKPREIVQDYRTSVSGIRPHDLENGENFEVIQNEVAELLKGRILVGHALRNDLGVLFLSHPRRFQRDTSRYNLFKRVSKGNTPSLKKLAAELLDVNIQVGEHNSVEDARTAMQLYVLYEKRWESDLRDNK